MIISKTYKSRLRELSGIVNEIELKATSGRSGVNTLSYFVEEYLLNLGGMLLDILNKKTEENPNKNFKINQPENKISNNSLFMSFQIEDLTDKNNVKEINFNLNLLVKLESNSNTVAILKYENVNDEFNLQSKHSEQDIQDFLNEITTRVFNVEKTA
jgi:hypothetical protein